jgi:glucokinase
MKVIGIDIGGTKSAVCAAPHFTSDGPLPEYERVPVATADPDTTLAALEAAVERLGPGPEPCFGISCGDPLDLPGGRILGPPNLPGWKDVPIVRRLLERFGGSARLMNDANAGALAEWWFGAGRGTRNLVFCTHGSGFGAGLVLEGRLYEGTTGGAGEIGHVRLTREGPLGYGKAGSVEGWISGGGIARQAAASGLAADSAREVAEAARGGDAAARALLHQSGRRLGEALAVLVDLFNPEVIVLGGLFPRIGDLLAPAMEESLRAEALPRARAACRIVPAQLGERIGDVAALCAAVYRPTVTAE